MSVSVGDGTGITRLRDLRQEGSLRSVFPRPPASGLEAVIVNTAGGVTGGDAFSITAHACPKSQLTLTTQAAERIYRAIGDEPGRIRNTLTIEDNAQLHWLPQETILFDGCNVLRSLNVDIAKTARFLMVEPLVFGRTASGESLRSCAFRDSVKLRCDGRLCYLDRINLTGNVAHLMQRGATGQSAGAMANVVLVARNAPQYLDRARALLPATGGASVLDQNVLVARILTTDSFALRRTLLPLLRLLSDDTVPKNWRL
ncbi:MAG: urease accessory protein UreD [Sulfitobacter sp.]